MELGMLEVYIQLNMASTRQWKLSPSSSPWSVVVCTPELCPKVTSSCGNFHLSHRALFGASFVDVTPGSKASSLPCAKN